MPPDPAFTLRPFARAALLFALALFLSLGSGCGKKSPSPFPGSSGKPGKKGSTPATQRPYTINGITYYPIPSAEGYTERGLASWYGPNFHGKKTSNGEVYDMYGPTAAHKTLPMNTILLVKNLENGQATTVRINDRGPFVEGRIIDLTLTKAKELGVYGKGTAMVEIIAMAADGGRKTPEQEQRAAAPPPPRVAKTEARPAPAIALSGKKDSVPPEPLPQKAPEVPDFDKGNFYVQVGAYKHIEKARLQAHVFAKRGKDAIIQQYPADGKYLYRVLIFASTSMKKAKEFEQLLKRQGFPTLLLAR